MPAPITQTLPKSEQGSPARCRMPRDDAHTEEPAIERSIVVDAAVAPRTPRHWRTSTTSGADAEIQLPRERRRQYRCGPTKMSRWTQCCLKWPHWRSTPPDPSELGGGIESTQSGACGSPPPRAYRALRRCGRVAEGGGLLNRYRVVKPYRGFESLRLRQNAVSARISLHHNPQ
jgi:hypothetical protein